MSDLDEIAAAAGIAIVEDNSGNGDAERSRDDNDKSCKPLETDMSLQSQVLDLETISSNRYTDADPDYVKVLEDNSAAHPPCVIDFYVRKPREDNRNWQGRYDGGDRRNYNYRGGRNDGWNRGYERHGGHGDYHRENRDYRHRENRDYRHSENRDRSPHR
ncbi:uncharacterized protein LOC106055353 [Biomphalaria glabrata]|uniref:Uncharacterized protein LOC106055353 n=1 Tax=Biomphalaria glabrata TaxID=6526 RepID=A0A9W2ZVM3_BIOGL|nr:uncharacterized protein LOC106055353 [Biomphalaria glabrata]XP_055879097.1 uncharacterized protein LOC106055353 [Biomphalaria glabrata]